MATADEITPPPAEPAPASPGEGHRWLVPGVDAYQPGDELQASDGWVLVSALVHGNVVGDGVSPVRRRVEQTPTEHAPPPPPAEPPAEAVRVVVRGTLVEVGRYCASVRFGDGISEWLPNDDVRVLRSLLPAGWPRDQLGHAKAPPRPIMDHLDANGRLAALERWIDAIPEPPGGWRGRDRVACDAITGLIRMFAPVRDMGASAWWKIEDAMAALAQLADEVEVGL